MDVGADSIQPLRIGSIRLSAGDSVEIGNSTVDPNVREVIQTYRQPVGRAV